MRAQQWTHVDSTLANALKLNNNVPVPSAKSLGPNQVLVRVLYTSLNPVDYKLPELPVVGRFAISKPASPCMDYCGTVAAAGSGRRDLSPGQKVYGKLEPPQFGACAEYIVVNSKDGCVGLPDGVKPEEAGAVGVAGLTAYQCIVPNLPTAKKSGAKPNVFINGGSGGTGTFGIQIAKAKGCRVVTTCSSRNTDFCRQLGADEVIDYTKQDVVAALVESAKTHGSFDLAVDNVGGPALYWPSHLYLSPNAKFVAVGATVGLQIVVDMAKIFLWPAVFGGGRRTYQFLGASTNADHYRDIARMMARGEVRAQIEEIYDLEDVGRAFERLHSGRVRGKLVVKVA